MMDTFARRRRFESVARIGPGAIELTWVAVSALAITVLLAKGAVAANDAGDERAFSEADVKRGGILFLQCRACHATSAEDGHRVGPNLSSLFGSVAGSRDGFVYSESMGASDVVWDEQTLFEFLEDPDAYFNGTKMAYAGLPDEADRRRLIEYLRLNTVSQ